MKDPLQTIAVIATYACIHAAANWAQENTAAGKSFRNFCQTWRTDSFLHLILCGLTMFTWGVVAIFALGLALRSC